MGQLQKIWPRQCEQRKKSIIFHDWKERDLVSFPVRVDKERKGVGKIISIKGETAEIDVLFETTGEDFIPKNYKTSEKVHTLRLPDVAIKGQQVVKKNAHDEYAVGFMYGITADQEIKLMILAILTPKPNENGQYIIHGRLGGGQRRLENADIDSLSQYHGNIADSTVFLYREDEYVRWVEDGVTFYGEVMPGGEKHHRDGWKTPVYMMVKSKHGQRTIYQKDKKETKKILSQDLQLASISEEITIWGLNYMDCMQRRSCVVWKTRSKTMNFGKKTGRTDHNDGWNVDVYAVNKGDEWEAMMYSTFVNDCDVQTPTGIEMDDVLDVLEEKHITLP